MKHLRSTVACAQIYGFLQSNSSKPINLSEVEAFIKSVLSQTNSPVLCTILVDFGWSLSLHQFENDDVDIAGLTLALSKSSMLLVTRTSQLGPNLSPKSFLPGLLLNYLCHVANQHEDSRKGIPADMTFYSCIHWPYLFCIIS